MANVRIPSVMQSYTNNKDVVTANGTNVRQLIHALDEDYPGLKAALMDEDKLKPDIAVVIDGNISRLGVLQPVSEENEVIFIPAIRGG